MPFDLNTVILERIFELSKKRSELESKLERTSTKSYSHFMPLELDKATIKKEIRETDKLIKINEDIFEANGGKLQ